MALEASASRHVYYRRAFGLPESTPRTQAGLRCSLCVRECMLGQGERGFCNVRTHLDGQIQGGDGSGAFLQSFHEPLPADCVSRSVCGLTQEDEGIQMGVFYESCSFDCLYCPNWHFKRAEQSQPVSADSLLKGVDPSTRCVRFYGGDPAPQIPHALETARRILEEQSLAGVRICWETNASVDPELLDEMAELSCQTGGVLRIDLKAYDDHIHRALCGVSNERTLRNFERVCSRRTESGKRPTIVASTPLVPGYIDPYEVDQIARFIAKIDRAIPYILLASIPDFAMSDLPSTSEQHAWQAEQAARAAGLSQVYVGNRHALGPSYLE